MTTPALDTLALLRRSSVFGELDDDALHSVAEHLDTATVMGGQTLFEIGDDAECLYLLRSGSIGIFRAPQAGGPSHLAGILASGDALGVTSLLLDQAHTTSARALRDSELLRLSQADYARLIDRHPRAMLGSAQLALRRLLARGGDEPRILPRTFALLPFDESVPARDTAEHLRHALLPFGNCLLIDAALGQDREPAWFAERESEVRFVLYVDEGRDDPWRDLCRRQADALLPLVQSDRQAAPWPDLEQLNEHADLERPRHLLLLHPDGRIVTGAARHWCDALDCTVQAHHVRGKQDLARIGRILARRATGVVLSGGGARGFAAIGIVRAMRECGIDIDRVGGTSMGAIIAAGIAMEWDDAAMREHFRSAFVDGKPLSDWTLPLVAISRGRRTSHLLMQHFGTDDIEDLALPFFCVSADLTDGSTRTHRRGPLWQWLRAASAVPGVLPPLFHDGHVLVDGGIINDLPIDVMYDHGVGTILACDIRAEGVLDTQLESAWSPGILQQWQQRERRPGIGSILIRSAMVNAETAANQRRALATQVLAPPLEDIALLDFEAFDRAEELGYRYGMEVLGKIAEHGSGE